MIKAFIRPFSQVPRGIPLACLQGESGSGQGAAIDTTNPADKLAFGIFAALSEYERALISECTTAGLASARAVAARADARTR